MNSPLPRDVAIVGAGAAGLATAIFARRAAPVAERPLLDGARKPGAKILVSGGGRCNVTNTVVADTDFWGGRRTIVRRVLCGACRSPRRWRSSASSACRSTRKPAASCFPTPIGRATCWRRLMRGLARRRRRAADRHAGPCDRAHRGGIRPRDLARPADCAGRGAGDRRTIAAEDRQRRRRLRHRARARRNPRKTAGYLR